MSLPSMNMCKHVPFYSITEALSSQTFYFICFLKISSYFLLIYLFFLYNKCYPEITGFLFFFFLNLMITRLCFPQDKNIINSRKESAVCQITAGNIIQSCRRMLKLQWFNLLDCSFFLFFLQFSNLFCFYLGETKFCYLEFSS